MDSLTNPVRERSGSPEKACVNPAPTEAGNAQKKRVKRENRARVPDQCRGAASAANARVGLSGCA